MRRDDYAKAIEDQGFKLVYNPPGDDSFQKNCCTIAPDKETRHFEIS